MWYLTEDKDKLIDLLKEHIFNNIVRIGNKYYQQIRGVWNIRVLRDEMFQLYHGHVIEDHETDLQDQTTEEDIEIALKYFVPKNYFSESVIFISLLCLEQVKNLFSSLKGK